MEWKTIIILYGDTCCNSRSHPHKNQYNYTTDILHFYFWQNGTGSSLFLKPTTDAKVFGFLGASFSSFGVFVFEFWVLPFRSRVLCFRVLGASFLRLRGLRFRSRVPRFRVLGASFSRFGCFVLRSSFSSASFSKLPLIWTCQGPYPKINLSPGAI